MHERKACRVSAPYANNSSKFTSSAARNNRDSQTWLRTHYTAESSEKTNRNGRRNEMHRHRHLPTRYDQVPRAARRECEV